MPDVLITTWCYEDTPLIWSHVLRTFGNIDHNSKVMGGLDMLATIMSREGMRRLRHYLHDHPGMTEAQKRRVYTAFLDKFALDDEIEEELDIPGWTPQFIEEAEDAYDDDVCQLGQMPGVTLLTP